MKKLLAFCCVLCAAFAAAAAGCAKDGAPPAAEHDVEVSALTASVSVKDTEVVGYDFTALFSITLDGENVPVLEEYVDSSGVSATAGDYTVTCSYMQKSASVAVTVVGAEYVVECDVEEITLYIGYWDTYDYLRHFKAYKDGAEVPITDDMVQNGVKEAVGAYDYTVSLNGVSATLKVNITDEHDVQIVHAYGSAVFTPAQLEDFDYTSLFMVYVDGFAHEVTPQMVDASALGGEISAGEYSVFLKVVIGSSTWNDVCKVRVADNAGITITAQNAVTYPNGGNVDLTSLFEIREGAVRVPVTMDMIEGSVDYSKEGDNVITLTYKGESAQATVTVKQGVLIGYTHGERVDVRVGTDPAAYDFAGDFSVTVNGIRFYNLAGSYLDLSAVDFSKVGTFEVKLTVRYCDSAPVDFAFPVQTVEKTITYNVVAGEYSVTVKSDMLDVPFGTKNFDPLGNVEIYVNGVRRTLTSNPEWVDSYTYLAVPRTSPDYNSYEYQEMVIDVYPEGAEGDAVTVSYALRFKPDVTITGKRIAVFGGATVFTTDLFEVTKDGERIPATYDMITGSVNTFKPGEYTVTAEYLGVKAEARVVVLDSEMVGVYRTPLKTVPEDTGEEEDDGGLWDGSYDEEGNYGTTPEPPKRFENLVISEDGSISFAGKTVEEVEGIDAGTLRLTISSTNTYLLHYSDGVAVLVPENTLMQSFTDYIRPLFYFDVSKWEQMDMLTLNTASEYVIGSELTNARSIDIVNMRRTGGGTMWYALDVRLVSKRGADAEYAVQWGGCSFNEDFDLRTSTEGVLEFKGESLSFTVGDPYGRISKNDPNSKYRGATLTGEIDGVQATVRINSEGIVSISGTGINFSGDRIESMTNGGAMGGDVLFVYGYDTNGVYSYKLRVSGSTFTLLPRDSAFGKYLFGDKMVFLDGYGTGIINFNVTSHIVTRLSYEMRSGEVNAEYVDTLSDFQYGAGAVFSLSPMLNVLTVKSCAHPAIPAGSEFVNAAITDGAIVTLDSAVYKSTGGDDKTRFLNTVGIKTAKGQLSGTEKTSLIDVSSVNFNADGFYKFTVKVTVRGEEIVCPYAVQIVTKKYAKDPLCASYSGLSGKMSLTLDENGFATVLNGSARYEGEFIPEGNAFTVRAYSADGAYLFGKGELVCGGVAAVSFGGAFTAAEYFKTASVKDRVCAGLVGGRFCYLREFTSAGETTYVYSTGGADFEVVTLQTVSDPVGAYEIFKKDGNSLGIYKIEWNNVQNGLQIV